MEKGKWKPISEKEMLNLIDDAEILMENPLKIFWDKIKIIPEKWEQVPWGNEGEGFWVIAIIGQHCIYYNDIEEGFNVSEYSSWGKINNYGCNQNNLIDFIKSYYEDFLKDISLS